MAILNSMGSSLLTQLSQPIQILSGDVLNRGNGVGTETLMGLTIHSTQMEIAGVDKRAGFFGQLTITGHHFTATGNHQIFHTRHNRGSGHINRGDT